MSSGRDGRRAPGTSAAIGPPESIQLGLTGKRRIIMKLNFDRTDRTETPPPVTAPQRGYDHATCPIYIQYIHDIDIIDTYT